MFLFPDTTVLCNFAAVRRMPLLREFLGDRGRWVQSVEGEVKRGVAIHQDLELVVSEDWFGAAVSATKRGEIARIERFRTLHMFGDPTKPLQHLGESETFVVLNRAEFKGAAFLTDDFDAHRIFDGFDVPVLDTRDVIESLVAWNSLSASEGFDICEEMAAKQRTLRRPPAFPRDLG
ncbi:hypothetical protein [Protaetiibacter intestinalis]|uniref:PIN domain-containing protein n=1 Tax=Protaetiibacter intestinalis TaxID=2419774 RepID=A0A387B7W1_9MICO|nr:hypothetical protein [Protaetiibacter intestinalis]AYF97186.1 hypothetical protein D7I47_02270 [Protaetiibacter intestinalis]